MNATIYVLQSPTLLVSFFVGQIPAVAVFFGIAYFVLSKVTRIKTRSLVGLAYFFAPALLLALSAWGIRAKDYSDGIQLLVPAILSVLSCGALYYQEWHYQHHKTLLASVAIAEQLALGSEHQTETAGLSAKNDGVQSSVSSDGAITASLVVSADQQINTPEKETEIAKPRLADSPPHTTCEIDKNNMTKHWGVLLSLLLVTLVAIYFSFGGGPSYIVEDGGEYGYKQVKSGDANTPIVLFRYAGIHNGKHQVYTNNEKGHIDTALECAVPCKAIKVMHYMNFGDNNLKVHGSFSSKNFIPVDYDSVELRVMKDAINGYLKVEPLNSDTLNFNKVSIEQRMEGVPIRPLFEEGGIRFEYMADAPRRETQNSPPSLEKQGGTQKSNTKEGSSESATAVPSPSPDENMQKVVAKEKAPKEPGGKSKRVLPKPQFGEKGGACNYSADCAGKLFCKKNGTCGDPKNETWE